MGNLAGYAGGVGLIATGVALIAGEIANKTYTLDAIAKGVGLIGTGLIAISHTGKQEAQVKELRENTRTVRSVGMETARAVQMNGESMARAMRGVSERNEAGR